MIKCFDASIPPPSAAPGCDAVLGYVGKAGHTPHVWTLDEWRRFQHLLQFPCYVPDLSADPVAEAREAVAAVEALGWAKEPEPHARAIICDTEIMVVPEWYARFAAEVSANGYVGVNYGSLTYAGANLASDLWAADWDDIAALVAGQTVHGTQFASGPHWDLSVIDGWLAARGGIGPRRG